MTAAPGITPAMKIGAVAPWFGGKRTLASRIVQELGEHDAYFEPFCGGLPIILSKPEARQETVNDLHGDLINLARVLRVRAAAEDLYDRLSRTLFHESLLADAAENMLWLRLDECQVDRDITPEAVHRAYWFFIASWMARNGVAGTDRTDYQAAVRWTAGGGSPTIRFNNAVDSIPAWHHRLKNVVMMRRDAFTIIPKFEDANHVAIYCDPPYPAETRSNLDDDGVSKSGGGGGRYLHEFAHGGSALFGGGADDHSRLADQLRAFKRARVVVSCYDCPRYRELYDGWTFVECHRQKNLRRQNAAKHEAAEAPEVLIINGPSFTAESEAA